MQHWQLIDIPRQLYEEACPSPSLFLLQLDLLHISGGGIRAPLPCQAGKVVLPALELFDKVGMKDLLTGVWCRRSRICHTPPLREAGD